MQDIATALDPLRLEIPGLQIVPMLNPNPTPPSIDVFPAIPFQTGAGFGRLDAEGRFRPAAELFFAIRARVSVADNESGQTLLLRMLDPSDLMSVEAAIADTATVTPEGVSEYREYDEDVATNGRLLGCEWRVATFL